MKIFLDFYPEIFVAFWGIPGSFLGFQQPSLFMILLIMSPRSSQEATKISGQNSRNIFVGILDETDFSLGHFEIN